MGWRDAASSDAADPIFDCRSADLRRDSSRRFALTELRINMGVDFSFVPKDTAGSAASEPYGFRKFVLSDKSHKTLRMNIAGTRGRCLLTDEISHGFILRYGFAFEGFSER